MSYLPKYQGKDTPISFLYAPTFLPKVGFSRHSEQGYTKHNISRNPHATSNILSPFNTKQSKNTIEFGLQVIKLPTQPRERTTVKTTRFLYQNPHKLTSISRAPTSVQKPQRANDILGQWPPITTTYKLPSLTPPLSQLQEKKQKAQSQNDINITSRRGPRPKLEKISLRKKKASRERNEDSFNSSSNIQAENIKETAETKPIEPVEPKSLNIVQRKLNQNKDSWFDLRDFRSQKKEVNSGGYLTKALNEVNTNVNVQIQSSSPTEFFKDNFESLTKHSVKEREKELEKTEKIAKLKNEGIRPNSNKGLISKSSKRINEGKKKESKENLNEEQEHSKLGEYHFDNQSDEDLSLEEYIKSKKEASEQTGREDLADEYNF